MKNLMMVLEDRPGALAAVGEVLGGAGVSIEGGGMFVADGRGVANFLVDDGAAGRRALEAAGIAVVREDEVVIQRLNQEEPGQLGKVLRRMAEAGVNLLAQYSDHAHQLVLVVEDVEAAKKVSEAWERERAAVAQPKKRLHRYAVRVEWTGNSGTGTSSYTGYGREHTIYGRDKEPIAGSSDPVFRGDRSRYNPEELLVASASACHMLSYLHLCSVKGVVVLSYEDEAAGEMAEVVGGAGAFVRVDLHPRVTIEADSDAELAAALHEEAHVYCFIANSLRVPVETCAEISVREREA